MRLEGRRHSATRRDAGSADDPLARFGRELRGAKEGERRLSSGAKKKREKERDSVSDVERAADQDPDGLVERGRGVGTRLHNEFHFF